MNKKGDVFDIIFVMIFLFVTAITIILGHFIYTSFYDQAIQNEEFNSSISEVIYDNAETTLLGMDYLFIFIMIGLLIMVIISSFSIQTHPVFFFISLLGLILGLVLAPIYANVYEEVTNNSMINQSASQYTVIPYVMNHYPFFILMIGAILLLIFYAKSRIEE